MKKFGILLLFFISVQASAQELSSFNSLTLTYKFHPKFFLYAEGQLRGIKEFSTPDYYEIKGGLGYNLTPNHKPFIGIGRYGYYTDRDFEREEFRVWLQDVLDVKKGVVKLENRVRAERSWFHNVQNGENTSRYRFRYRLNVSVPLNSKKVEPGTLFANVYDEVFFTPSDTEPVFSRNRLYGGLGYQIDETFGVASGYLWQREFASKGNKNINFVYLALNITIDNAEEKEYEFPGAD